MATIVFVVGCAIWINSLVFSERWLGKHGVPPGPVNVRSVLIIHLQRFLLGATCIAGYFMGGVHFLWIVAGGAILFTAFTGLLSVVIFQSTGGVKRFENPSVGLRKYNVGKAAVGLILQSGILLAWIANWLTVWFGGV